MSDDLDLTKIIGHTGFLDVLKFHEQFDLPRGGAPRLLTPELFEFRRKFMHEELKEFEDAFAAGDLIGAVDALVDLVYVAYGTAVMMGVPWPHVWRHVQTANLKKVRCETSATSKRGSAFDVRKPLGWKSPEAAITTELLIAGWRPLGKLVFHNDGKVTEEK